MSSQPRALPGESYQAALTPGMVSAIFGSLVPAATLAAGGYVQLAGETGWWIPSGRVYYSAGDTDTPAAELAAARGAISSCRCRAVDPFGAITRAGYDGHALLPATATDAVGNVTSAVNDYRVLAPATVTDPNGNRASLGVRRVRPGDGHRRDGQGHRDARRRADRVHRLTWTRPRCSPPFADPTGDPAAVLGNATTRILYDTAPTSGPAARRSPRRPPSTRWPARPMYPTWRDRRRTRAPRGRPATSTTSSTATGSGGRSSARPGRRPDPVTAARRGGPRSGWTIYDNKGRPVRTYEPFFTATNAFEFGAASGVSHGHAVRPAWPRRRDAPSRQQLGEDHLRPVAASRQWDGDDTVLVADPRTDPDVGDYFARLLGTARVHLLVRPAHRRPVRLDARAAGRAAGRGAQDGAVRRHPGHGAPRRARPGVPRRRGQRPGSPLPGPDRLDTEGKPLAVFDALGRRAEEHCYRSPDPGGGFTYIAGTDMAGRPVYRISADGGARRALLDVAGQAIRTLGRPRPRVPARLRPGAAASRTAT